MESHVDILQGCSPDRGKSPSRCLRSKVFRGWNIKVRVQSTYKYYRKHLKCPYIPEKAR